MMQHTLTDASECNLLVSSGERRAPNTPNRKRPLTVKGNGTLKRIARDKGVFRNTALKSFQAEDQMWEDGKRIRSPLNCSVLEVDDVFDGTFDRETTSVNDILALYNSPDTSDKERSNIERFICDSVLLFREVSNS